MLLDVEMADFIPVFLFYFKNHLKGTLRLLLDVQMADFIPFFLLFFKNYLKGILRLLLDVELVDFVPVFADGRHVLHPSFATHLID